MKLPTRFDAALAEICALGDEAHYDQTPRYIGKHPDAMTIVESFENRRQRVQLIIAFMDSYDIAADRQLVAVSLGAELAIRIGARA